MGKRAEKGWREEEEGERWGGLFRNTYRDSMKRVGGPPHTELEMVKMF